MKDWIFRNLALRIICLVIAVFFWFLAAVEGTYEIKHSLPLEVLIEDTTQVLASDPPKQVEVIFSGKGIDLLRLLRADSKVVLRIGRMDVPDELKWIVLHPSMVELPEGLSVQPSAIHSPKEIKLDIDHVITRSVEVYSAIEVKPASGYIQVGATEVEPRRVRISGGSLEVMPVDSIATIKEVIEGVEGNFSKAVTLDVSGFRTITALSPETVVVTGRVEVLKEKHFEKRPVVLRGSTGEEFSLEPKTVDLILGVAESKFDNVKAEDIKAYVIVDETPGENAVYEVQVELPANTVLISKFPEECHLIPSARAEAGVSLRNSPGSQFSSK